MNKHISVIILLTFCFSACSFDKSFKELQSIAWTNNAVFYEMSIRNCITSGKLKDGEHFLQQLKKLGVNTLIILPAQTQSYVPNYFIPGHLMCIKDYNTIHPDLGTPTEFKEFLSKAKTLGYRTLMQWDLAYTDPEHIWKTKHPDWFLSTSLKKDSLYNIDFITLDYSKKQVCNAMIAALQDFSKDFPIDGYVFHHANTLPVDALKKICANVFSHTTLLSVCADSVIQKEQQAYFHIQYNWPLYHFAESIARQPTNSARTQQAINALMESWSSNRINFINNSRLNANHGNEIVYLGSAHRLMAALTYFFGGNPMLFNGQEEGQHFNYSLAHQTPIEFKYLIQFDFYRKIHIQFLKNPALWSNIPETKNQILFSDGKVLVFKRSNKNATYVSILNLTEEKQVVELPESFLNYHELWSGTPVNFTKQSSFGLGPYQYLGLTNRF